MDSAHFGKPLFAAFLSATFFLAPTALPVLGIVLGYICPLPLLWIYLRYGQNTGRKTLGAALAITLVLTYLLFGVGLGVSYIYHLGLAAGMGEAICRGQGRVTMMIWGILLGSIANLAIMLGTAWYYGQDLVSFWLNYWQGVLSLLSQPSMGLDALQEQAKAKLLQAIFALAPALLLISSSLVCWLNLWALNRLTKRLLPAANWGYANLTAWYAPDKLAWLFIAAAMLFWLTEGSLSWAAGNLLLVCGIIYWFQGMAMANWWADKKGLPLWSRVLILIVCFFLPFLLFAVVLAGLLDALFNWRKAQPAE